MYHIHHHSTCADNSTFVCSYSPVSPEIFSDYSLWKRDQVTIYVPPQHRDGEHSIEIGDKTFINKTIQKTIVYSRPADQNVQCMDNTHVYNQLKRTAVVPYIWITVTCHWKQSFKKRVNNLRQPFFSISIYSSVLLHEYSSHGSLLISKQV